jgi:hypothetical protein
MQSLPREFQPKKELAGRVLLKFTLEENGAIKEVAVGKNQQNKAQ